MKEEIKYIVAVLIAIGLMACHRTLKTDEYVKHIRNVDNGLRKIVEVGDWEYDIQYKPSDYILSLEQVSDSSRKRRQEELKGTVWFNISFMNKTGKVSALRYGLGSIDEYDGRLGYFLNGAEAEIQMVYGLKDTLKPIAYEFENNYNLAPQETMVVGFKLPDGEERIHQDLQLVYNDKIYKTGIIKVKILKGSVENIPGLAL